MEATYSLETSVSTCNAKLCQDPQDYSWFFFWVLTSVLNHGCTNHGCQIAQVTEFCLVVLIWVGPQYWTCFMSPFWCLELWGGS
jgi:hypothetical protein